VGDPVGADRAVCGGDIDDSLGGETDFWKLEARLDCDLFPGAANGQCDAVHNGHAGRI